MKTSWTLLPAAAVLALGPAAAASALDLQPFVVSDLGGDLHIHQSLPAGCDDVDQSTPVTGGRIEIAPAEGAPVLGGRRFVMTRTTVIFAPFTIHRSCLTQDVTRDYTALGVEAATAVTLVAAETSPGVFTFSIPTADVPLLEEAILNGAPETGYKQPRDPVTGTLDLTNGTLQMTVVAATKVHVDVLGDYDGALTANLSGTIHFPDSDADGVPDRTDNCRFVANPDQTPVPTPTLLAPADVTFSSCADTAIGPATAFDVCDLAPVTLTNDASPPFPVGTTLVTWQAEDAKGRKATAGQHVTVVDTTPPTFTFVPADLTLADCGPADVGLATATDDCAGTPAVSSNSPGSFGVGSTTVTWTATDASGNHATATQVVTVHDTTPPTVSCLPGTNPAGHPSHGGFFQVFTTDNCTPTMRLGSYVLANGEDIKITETGQPGVRFVNTMGGGIRHFQVGPGENVITSTDESGNTARATCH